MKTKEWALQLNRTLLVGHAFPKVGQEYYFERRVKVSDLFESEKMERFVPLVDLEDFVEDNRDIIDLCGGFPVVQFHQEDHQTSKSMYRQDFVTDFGLVVKQTVVLPKGNYSLSQDREFDEARRLLSPFPFVLTDAFGTISRFSILQHFLMTKPVASIRDSARRFVLSNGLYKKDFVAIHVRRSDFEEYCANKMKQKDKIRTSQVDSMTLDVLISPPLPSCWPSWEEISLSLSSFLKRTKISPQDNRFDVFLMTDADDQSVEMFRRLLLSHLSNDGKESVSLHVYRWKPSKEEEEGDIETFGVLVDTEISTFASHFVGNRYSSVSFSVFSRRLEIGLRPSSLHLW